MSNVDTTIDSVRELILNHTAAEVDRAVHEYIRILHGQTGLNMNFLTSLVRRIPGASVRTTCLGINKKTGKKCTNVACGDTGYCERHISQHPNFSALSGGGGEMMVCEPVVKKQKIAPTQQDFEDEEEAFKELDNYHLRGIPE
jgi:hypothetical protein|tara:strand:+ start:241 stop:669 length:429 start_codon:yes stop_codon:yes gene_type:complete